MAWLHTWAGVVVGGLLFAIFWMGTLSVFDREIDRWMIPGTRLAANAAHVSSDKAAAAVALLVLARASQWRLDLPTPRAPLVRFSYRDGAGNTTTRYLDPANYTLIPDQGTKGGTGFIFPFHCGLHLKWMDLWLVDSPPWRCPRCWPLARGRAAEGGRPALHLLLERDPVTRLPGTAALCALLRWDVRVDREINGPLPLKRPTESDA